MESFKLTVLGLFLPPPSHHTTDASATLTPSLHALTFLSSLPYPCAFALTGPSSWNSLLLANPCLPLRPQGPVAIPRDTDVRCSVVVSRPTFPIRPSSPSGQDLPLCIEFPVPARVQRVYLVSKSIRPALPGGSWWPAVTEQWLWMFLCWGRVFYTPTSVFYCFVPGA